MAEWVAASDAELRDLAEWLASWTWPLEQPDAVELARDHGWTVVSDRPGRGAICETGLPGNKSWASITVADNSVARMSIATSEVLPEGAADGERFVRDVFADQVAVLTEVLGEPAERTPGAEPEARWYLANGSAVKVLATKRSVSWVLTSPEFVEIERDLQH